MADDIKLRVGVEGLNDIAKVVTETEKLEKKVKLLATSFERGNLTNKAYFKGLNQQIVALRKLGYDYKTAQSYVHGLAKSTREAIVVQDQFAAAAQASQKAMHRNGVVMQQAGYQVGDFLVQVQSGTNAFVAFGQQATQLVGVMGMLNPKLIGLSAGLGIAIPLVTAIGAAWMKSRAETDKATDSLSELEDQIKSLDDSIKDWLQTRKAAELGITVDELVGKGAVEDAEQAYADALAAYQNYLYAINDPEAVKGLVAAREAGMTLWEIMMGDEDAAAKRFQDAVNVATERLANIRRMASQERLQYVAEERQVLNDQLAISKLIVQYGEDSAEVKAEELAQERRLYEEELRRNDVGKATVQSLLEQFDLVNRLVESNNAMLGPAQEYLKAVSDLEEEIGKAATEALKLGGVDIVSGVSEAAKAAAQLAASMGITLAAARALQTQRAGLAGQYEQYGQGRQAFDEAAGDYRTSIDYLLGPEEAARIREILNPSKSRSSGGGKTAAETLQDNLDKLIETLKTQELLNGKTEAQRQIIQALGSNYQDIDATILQGLEDKINKQIEYNKTVEQQQNIFDVVQSSIENAFMSIIDGTTSAKDAFKSMAAEILKELYRVLVVQQMVGSWNQTTGTGTGLVGMIAGAFQADGGVWSSGRQVNAFANGGVVSGPTTFPMAGGQTGLMGEAGPEAIMPLKRGANGKLGVQAEGQGSVNIVQNFSFSANGDDSVKRIIAQAAPQIAQMTQKQIMDSRRRGGQMKATFS